ncbi:MAG TPA: TonB-dependent receptor [Terriglobales bacterium]|nr:TonB-dependent receptor [Terriglobales bacterium]
MSILQFCCIPLVVIAALPGVGQEPTALIRVIVQANDIPLSGAVVKVLGRIYQTDTHGMATFRLPPGRIDLKINAAGYTPQSTAVTAAAGQEQEITVVLEKVKEESITVSATRTDANLDDIPTRVEVLPAEEIEEKVSMTPGDVAMMLNEMGGLRVQATSPSLGAASVRVQGMRGRYTRFLSDGLPLFGQQVGGLGILQIPPMDLGQVEVIKGVSSALYGAGAMGGVVNLISRHPTDEPIREFLLNQSTRGATDVVFYGSNHLRHGWSASLTSSANFQLKNDINGDGWADLAGYQRVVVRPRFYWENGTGTNAFLTAGVTYEDRRGGTVDDRALPPTGLPYRESLESRNVDVGGKWQTLIEQRVVIGLRFAASKRVHRHVFGEVLERDVHDSSFAEATVRTSFRKHTIVAGAAVEADRYSPRDVPEFKYKHLTPGIFFQDDVDLKPWLSISASGRFDHHNVYGSFFSPRIAVLARKDGWSGRLAVGQGFSPATPLVEETEAAGLKRLIIPRSLRAERGKNFTFDLTKRAGAVSGTVTLFGSRVNDPLAVDRETFTLTNLRRPTINHGAELLFSFRPEDISVTGYYTYVRATEVEGSQRREVALTPRHSAGLDLMWEEERKFRLGVELYYTGKQRLEANPYRLESRGYILVGFLAQRWFGRVRAFINAENLTGVRQTDYDPLIRPTRAVDGRWTVDAWAPLDGRVFNGGVRFSF